MHERDAALQRELRITIAGDTAAMSRIASAPQSELLLAAEHCADLALSPQAVARVLEGLLNRTVSPSDAQQWASFVRRGFVAPQPSGPVRAVDIAYDPEHEEVLATVVSRLDEIGDLVDGEVSDHELAQLLRLVMPTGAD